MLSSLQGTQNRGQQRETDLVRAKQREEDTRQRRLREISWEKQREELRAVGVRPRGRRSSMVRPTEGDQVKRRSYFGGKAQN